MNAPILSLATFKSTPFYALTFKWLNWRRFAFGHHFFGCQVLEFLPLLLVLSLAGRLCAQQSGVKPFELPERIVNPAAPPLTLPGLPLSVPAIDTPGGEVRDRRE
jgi:hypothetical protein